MPSLFSRLAALDDRTALCLWGPPLLPVLAEGDARGRPGDAPSDSPVLGQRFMLAKLRPRKCAAEIMSLRATTHHAATAG